VASWRRKIWGPDIGPSWVHSLFLAQHRRKKLLQYIPSYPGSPQSRDHSFSHTFPVIRTVLSQETTASHIHSQLSGQSLVKRPQLLPYIPSYPDSLQSRDHRLSITATKNKTKQNNKTTKTNKQKTFLLLIFILNIFATGLLKEFRIQSC
jgi:hypothetical protein